MAWAACSGPGERGSRMNIAHWLFMGVIVWGTGWLTYFAVDLIRIERRRWRRIRDLDECLTDVRDW